MNPDREPFDPTLDALLHAHADEAPSPEIDAAILAAAHRAVQSGPRESNKRAAATSAWRWWMPLAAAATIGAITIGVLQLMPKELEPTSATIMSDTPPSASAVSEPNTPPPPAAAMSTDKVEAPRAKTDAPQAKARADRPAPAPPMRNEAERAAASEPFPAQRERDAATRESAGSAPSRMEAPAPALAKQSAAATVAQSARPEQWIARIRQLLADGKTDDAARELSDFRAAFPDADARLPAELQTWAASVKR